MRRIRGSVGRSAVMPPDMRAAWVKYNLEEVGNLRFFLPDLYRHEMSLELW